MRGEYRSTYVALWDDDDFLALPRDAKLALRYLRDVLPAVGIGRVSAFTACAKLGMAPGEWETALAALETPKVGRAQGWIVREAGMIWVVNALRFDPALTPKNAKKHRPFIQRLAAQLDGNLAVVQAFRVYYADWFDPAAPAATSEAPTGSATPPAGAEPDAGGKGKGSDTPSKGKRKGIDRVSVPNAKGSGRVAKHIDVDVDVDQGSTSSPSAQTGEAPGGAPNGAPGDPCNDPPPSPDPADKSAPWMGEVRALWRRHFDAVPPAQAVKILRPLVKAHGIAAVCARLDVFIPQLGGRFVDLHRFATTWASWDPAAPAAAGRGVSQPGDSPPGPLSITTAQLRDTLTSADLFRAQGPEEFWARADEVVPDALDGETWRALLRHVQPWKLGGLRSFDLDQTLKQRLASFRPATSSRSAA